MLSGVRGDQDENGTGGKFVLIVASADMYMHSKRPHVCGFSLCTESF